MSVLKQLQQSFADHLSADSYFSTPASPGLPVPAIITENVLDITNMIQTAISKIGASVIIITPQANVPAEDVPYVYFENVTMIARCFELPTVNRGATGSQKPAFDMAEMVAAIGHHFTPLLENSSGPDINTTWVLANPAIRLIADKQFLIYDVRFKVSVGLQVSFEQLDTVVASISGGTLTASTTTPGAAIFYTSDGSNPSPINPNAHLYLTPVTGLTTGTKVRLKNWLAGYLAGNEVILTA